MNKLIVEMTKLKTQMDFFKKRNVKGFQKETIAYAKRIKELRKEFDLLVQNAFDKEAEIELNIEKMQKTLKNLKFSKEYHMHALKTLFKGEEND